MPDKYLIAELNAALGKSGTDSVTAAELATLTRLVSTVFDLRRLELCLGLEELVLTIRDTSTNDILPLAGLANLSVLTLRGSSSNLSNLSAAIRPTMLAPDVATPVSGRETVRYSFEVGQCRVASKAAEYT